MVFRHTNFTSISYELCTLVSTPACSRIANGALNNFIACAAQRQTNVYCDAHVGRQYIQRATACSILRRLSVVCRSWAGEPRSRLTSAFVLYRTQDKELRATWWQDHETVCHFALKFRKRRYRCSYKVPFVNNDLTQIFAMLQPQDIEYFGAPVRLPSVERDLPGCAQQIICAQPAMYFNIMQMRVAAAQRIGHLADDEHERVTLG